MSVTASSFHLSDATKPSQTGMTPLGTAVIKEPVLATRMTP
ncbi:MAG: hypothetical protein ACEY3F_05145 [Wolbachia sp.]